MLSATSVGIVIPVLADAGQSTTTLGQLIIAGAGLLSVVLFPLGALTLLRGRRKAAEVAQRDDPDDAGRKPGPT